jgi:hypothetical protein
MVSVPVDATLCSVYKLKPQIRNIITIKTLVCRSNHVITKDIFKREVESHRKPLPQYPEIASVPLAAAYTGNSTEQIP